MMSNAIGFIIAIRKCNIVSPSIIFMLVHLYCSQKIKDLIVNSGQKVCIKCKKLTFQEKEKMFSFNTFILSHIQKQP